MTVAAQKAGRDEILFVRDIQEELKMSRQLVMEAIHTGDLEAEEYGTGKNRYRVRRSKLEEWRRRHLVRPSR